eukprot:jgi/Bigna1/80666/fgenesh1_pg.73_\
MSIRGLGGRWRLTKTSSLALTYTDSILLVGLWVLIHEHYSSTPPLHRHRYHPLVGSKAFTIPRKKPKWAKPWDRPTGKGKSHRIRVKQTKMLRELERIRSKNEMKTEKKKQTKDTTDTNSSFPETQSRNDKENSHKRTPILSQKQTTSWKATKRKRVKQIPVMVGSLRNHYAVLQVRFNATSQDIIQAFRRMSVKLHPDKVEKSEKRAAHHRFLQLKEAYEVLSGQQRRKYNRELSDAITREFLGNFGGNHYGGDLMHLERVVTMSSERRKKKRRKRKKEDQADVDTTNRPAWLNDEIQQVD